MKICVMVYAPQKGLLISLGTELSALGYAVAFAAEDRSVAASIRRHFPDIGEAELVVMSGLGNAPGGDFDSECLRREEEYGETFAMMAAHDRGLGKGYLFNVQGHPSVIKAWWPKDRKYAEVLNEFIQFEAVFDGLRPDLVIGVAIPKSAHLICRARGIAVRILTPPRFGSLYRWAVNEYEDCPELSHALERRVAELAGVEKLPATVMEQTVFAQHFFSSYKYDYLSALKKAVGRIPVETYQLARRTHKRFKGGYEYLGWCGPILRKPYIYSYLERHGVRPDSMEGCRIVLFPLHMEPEASLLNISPELNNSMELIAWVSKSLPSDTVLVVKEHPDSFGLRPCAYYDNLRRMANVVIAHPEVSGKQWLTCCDILANITSTMAFEAVAMEKPVISFGSHQVINHLPTVEFADSFSMTRRALRRLLTPEPDRSRQLQISRVALDMAFRDVCFNLEGYELIFTSEELHMDMTRKALGGLQQTFPALTQGAVTCRVSHSGVHS